MHLDGTHTLAAPIKAIWDALLDPEILAKITPGVKRLEPTGEDQYDAIFEVKIGPVSGAFKGKMEVTDKVDLESFKLAMKMNGKIGNVAATGTLGLKELGESSTEVNFGGDAKLSGTIARTGQRVITGVANKMTQQFFESLEEELAARGHIQKEEEESLVEQVTEAVSDTVESAVDAVSSAAEAVSTATAETVTEVKKMGLFQRFIAWLKRLFGGK